MKPIYLEKDTQSAEQSFFFRYAEVPHTYNQFHFHKEFELLYNVKNSGTRFVGDSIHRFESGDLVLVGPNIPHYWHSDDEYFRNDPTVKAKVILVQFVENFLGSQFVESPEMAPVRDLLSRASQGIQIRGREADSIGSKIAKLNNYTGWRRLTRMVEILCLMGEVSDYRLLASSGFCQAYKVGSEEKISQIFNFMIEHYNKDFRLKELADFANMNTSAFCRYFKKSTSKTFSEVLNEIRIGFACKMLINTDQSISQIGYSIGYLNIPYFNRQFKKMKSTTPLKYRELHRAKKFVAEKSP